MNDGATGIRSSDAVSLPLLSLGEVNSGAGVEGGAGRSFFGEAGGSFFGLAGRSYFSTSSGVDLQRWRLSLELVVIGTISWLILRWNLTNGRGATESGAESFLLRSSRGLPLASSFSLSLSRDLGEGDEHSNSSPLATPLSSDSFSLRERLANTFISSGSSSLAWFMGLRRITTTVSLTFMVPEVESQTMVGLLGGAGVEYSSTRLPIERRRAFSPGLAANIGGLVSAGTAGVAVGHSGSNLGVVGGDACDEDS